MSQIIDLDALMIGTFAAHLGGALPDWRAGRIADIDLVCSLEAAQMLATAYGAEFFQHAPTRGTVRHPLGLRFDIDLRPDAAAVLLQYADQRTIWVAGQQLMLWVARPVLVYAIRKVTAELVPSFVEKVGRDIAGYEDRGLNMDGALEALARSFIFYHGE